MTHLQHQDVISYLENRIREQEKVDIVFRNLFKISLVCSFTVIVWKLLEVIF